VKRVRRHHSYAFENGGLECGRSIEPFESSRIEVDLFTCDQLFETVGGMSANDIASVPVKGAKEGVHYSTFCDVMKQYGGGILL
jgi:hypothetical protein